MSTVKITFCPDPNYEDDSLSFGGNIEFSQELRKIIEGIIPEKAKWSLSPCPLGCKHEQYEFEIPVEKFAEILKQLKPIENKEENK